MCCHQVYLIILILIYIGICFIAYTFRKGLLFNMVSLQFHNSSIYFIVVDVLNVLIDSYLDWFLDFLVVWGFIPCTLDWLILTSLFNDQSQHLTAGANWCNWSSMRTTIGRHSLFWGFMSFKNRYICIYILFMPSLFHWVFYKQQKNCLYVWFKVDSVSNSFSPLYLCTPDM